MIVSFKVIVAGAYGSNNFGDDCLMFVCNEVLKQHLDPSEFAFLCNGSYEVTGIVSGANLLYSPLRTDYSCDVYLYGGGTQIYSFQNGIKTTFNLFIKRLQRFLVLTAGAVGLASRSRTVKYSISAGIGLGFGPFAAGSLRQKKAKFLVKRMSFLAVRDLESFKFCNSINSNTFLSGDLCYWSSLKDHLSFTRANPKNEKVRSIGFVVRDWGHDKVGDSYHSQLREVADRLLKEGKKVTFIFFAGNKDQTWMARVGNRYNFISWDSSTMSLQSFIDELKQFDLLVTSRFHGAVFATLLGIPFVSINVEQKLELIARTYGLDSLSWSYPFTSDDLTKVLSYIEANYADLKVKITSVAKEQELLVDSMLANFELFLLASLQQRKSL